MVVIRGQNVDFLSAPLREGFPHDQALATCSFASAAYCPIRTAKSLRFAACARGGRMGGAACVRMRRRSRSPSPLCLINVLPTERCGGTPFTCRLGARLPLPRSAARRSTPLFWRTASLPATSATSSGAAFGASRWRLCSPNTSSWRRAMRRLLRRRSGGFRSLRPLSQEGARVRAARGRSAVVAGVDARRLARPAGERRPHRPGSAHGRTRSAQRKRADRPQDRSSQALGVRGPWWRRRGVSSEGGFERAVEELTSDDEGSRPVRARLLIDLGLFADGSPGGITP